MQILQGRDFVDTDTIGGPPVAAISESAAKRFFGAVSPLGRTLRSDLKGQEFQIIAVVRDARYNTLRDTPEATVFVPYTARRARTRMTLAVRTADSERDAAGYRVRDKLDRSTGPGSDALAAIAAPPKPQPRTTPRDRRHVFRRRGGASPRIGPLRHRRVLGRRAHAGDRRAPGAWGNEVAGDLDRAETTSPVGLLAGRLASR